MTILFCLSDINKSLQWQWYAEELKNRGINQVYILVNKYKRGKDSYFYHDLKNAGITVYLLQHKNRFSYIRNIIKIIFIIKRHRADIVHGSLPLGNIVGQIAAYLCGIKNRVTTCENASWAHDFKSRKQELVDKLTYRLSKKVIAVADAAKEYLKDNYHLDDKKLLSIYHGLKESEYENISEERITKLRQVLEIRKEDFIVGVISRYEFWKGHEYIIKAAAILKARNLHADIKILIFGSTGTYFDTAMQQMKEQKVEDILMYKGFNDDPVALFQVFDVHLHVPVNKYIENCGINIIEGMISARPQILTRSGYAWQSAKHMKNAYVVEYKNAEAIADAIIYLKENKETARQLGKQAKADAISTYGLKVKVDRHIELYNSMLN